MAPRDGVLGATRNSRTYLPVGEALDPVIPPLTHVTRPSVEMVTQGGGREFR